ncbi:VOC family protein [Amycolatopsis speibonae]|uniref:VOC family protein n=1 Tax=Amycolatopsis speibonae TaxID=1450224 RepID=A0ABV7NQS2_9PSEU
MAGLLVTPADGVPRVAAPGVKAIANISIPVSNQDAGKDFYVGKLGFQVIADQPNPPGRPGRWLQLSPPGGGTTVVLATWWDTMPAGSSRGLGITTDDCAGTVAALRAAGVKVTDCVQSPPGPIAYFSDPDGNQWEMVQPVTP